MIIGSTAIFCSSPVLFCYIPNIAVQQFIPAVCTLPCFEYLYQPPVHFQSTLIRAAACFLQHIPRYRARHSDPLVTPGGQQLVPLAVIARHHLLLLLPEPVPAASGGTAAAAAAAAEGAAAGGAAEGTAAAATGPGYRDIALCFDLSLHHDLEALLLAAPDPLSAWAYDGDHIWGLPRGFRALCSRTLLLDPATAAAAVADGGLQQEAVVTGEGEEKAEGWKRVAVGVVGTGLSGKQVEKVARRLKGLAEEGWQPLLLLPGGDDAGVGVSGGGREGGKVEGSLLGVLRRMEGEGQQGEERVGGELQALDVDPLELIRHPEKMRSLFGYMREQQQESSASGVAATAAAGAAGGLDLTEAEKARALRQLRLVHGWQWQELQLQPEGSGAAVAGQLGEAVQGKWWKGELLRGSVLLEDEEEVLEGGSHGGNEEVLGDWNAGAVGEAGLKPAGSAAGSAGGSARWFYSVA